MNGVVFIHQLNVYWRPGNETSVWTDEAAWLPDTTTNDPLLGVISHIYPRACPQIRTDTCTQPGGHNIHVIELQTHVCCWTTLLLLLLLLPHVCEWFGRHTAAWTPLETKEKWGEKACCSTASAGSQSWQWACCGKSGLLLNLSKDRRRSWPERCTISCHGFMSVFIRAAERVPCAAAGLFPPKSGSNVLPRLKCA